VKAQNVVCSYMMKIVVQPIHEFLQNELNAKVDINFNHGIL